MNTFYLKVISSDKVFYEGRCEYLIIPTPEGQKGVLAHHENMVVAVEIGELHLRTDKGEWITAAVSKGFAEIMNNRVSVLVNSAERPEEIDIKTYQARTPSDHFPVKVELEFDQRQQK